MQKTKKSNWVIVLVFSVLALLFLVNDVLAQRTEPSSKLVSEEKTILFNSNKQNKVFNDFDK